MKLPIPTDVSRRDFIKRPEPQIKYLSGTAVYRKQFELPSVGGSLWLNLGVVNATATVRLNDIELGTLWKLPYCMDISAAAKSGTNHLEIEVVNTWLNRLVFEEHSSGSSELTFVIHKGWQADSKLLPARLIGPVQLIVIDKQNTSIRRNAK